MSEREFVPVPNWLMGIDSKVQAAEYTPSERVLTRTSLAAPADTARAPFPLALWRAIVSSSTAPLPFARRLSARGWRPDTARCAGDIAIVACKKKEHTAMCALSFWNRHRHTLPGPRRFRLIRRQRTSLAAPPDTARAPSPLALWRAIVSSSAAPLSFARRLSARG